MSQLTRRSLLAGSAAAALGTISAGAPAYATAPLAGKQAPGFYRYTVGTYEITVVTDGAGRFPLPEDFVTNIKKDEVQAALAAAHMSSEVFFNPFNPIVVNTGSKLVLIDTGTGEANYQQS